MNADGTDQMRLTTNAAADRSPAWSPDGTKIAFASKRTGNGDIYVMNADGTGQRRLTTNAAADRSPDWSPDGTKIAFASKRTGNGDIYVMDGQRPDAADDQPCGRRRAVLLAACEDRRQDRLREQPQRRLGHLRDERQRCPVAADHERGPRQLSGRSLVTRKADCPDGRGWFRTSDPSSRVKRAVKTGRANSGTTAASTEAAPTSRRTRSAPSWSARERRRASRRERRDLLVSKCHRTVESEIMGGDRRPEDRPRPC